MQRPQSDIMLPRWICL